MATSGPPVYSLAPSASNELPVMPLFGVGPDGDPGYLAMLRPSARPTMLGRLRGTMATLAVVPLAILALTPVIARGGNGLFGPLPLWIFVPQAACFAVALLVGWRVPGVLVAPGGPAGPDQRAVARTAGIMFRRALFLRFALADLVIMLGLPLSVVGHSPRPYLVGFVLGYPLLLGLALPTRLRVERMRRRLEAAGVESYLWAVLLAPELPPERRVS